MRSGLCATGSVPPHRSAGKARHLREAMRHCMACSLLTASNLPSFSMICCFVLLGTEVFPFAGARSSEGCSNFSPTVMASLPVEQFSAGIAWALALRGGNHNGDVLSQTVQKAPPTGLVSRVSRKGRGGPRFQRTKSLSRCFSLCLLSPLLPKQHPFRQTASSTEPGSAVDGLQGTVISSHWVTCFLEPQSLNARSADHRCELCRNPCKVYPR